MKQLLYLFVGVLVLASCSAPKLAYRFDTHRYQSAAKNPEATEQRITPGVNPNELVATTEATLVETGAVAVNTSPAATKGTLTKKEQREFRSQLKTQLKTQLTPEKKAEIKKQLKADKAQGMDHDLKLAAVFGAVGVVGILLGGAAEVFFIIGGIALLIGVIFFIKWLIRQ